MLACFACLPGAQAVPHKTPAAPETALTGFNTADGDHALFSLTTGVANVANGWYSLFSNTDGSYNTAVGAGTLVFNIGDQGTFQGIQNTAVGAAALLSNTTGLSNTAVGARALLNNTEGVDNTANGVSALLSNTTGDFNTANGAGVLYLNTTGSANTATGGGALAQNDTGDNNTAVGMNALFDVITGSNNVALGSGAGDNITGSGNVCIGADVDGAAGEDDTTRIRNIGSTPQGGGLTVTVESVGGTKLGYVPSSRRYKQDIRSIDKASEALFALRPVAFRYKKRIDPRQMPAFGLIAEEVEKVNPELVAHNSEGQPESVRYEYINAMLLNEFLKEHKTVQELKSTVASQEATIAQQQKDFQTAMAQQRKQIADLTASLKEQAAQIERVSVQLAAASPSRGGLEGAKPAAQMVLNNP